MLIKMLVLWFGTDARACGLEEPIPSASFALTKEARFENMLSLSGGGVHSGLLAYQKSY